MSSFNYTDERFADIQMLRYELTGFSELPLKKKLYIYCLAKAAEAGRDITFDQNGKYNLEIRELLEAVYRNCLESCDGFDGCDGFEGIEDSENLKAFKEYLKRVWFSNGIHHHYGMEKFQPGFEREWFEKEIKKIESKNDYRLSIIDKSKLLDIIFSPTLLPKRVNKAEGEDLVATSACNFYQDVTQKEVEDFYGKMSAEYKDEEMPSFGLNSTLCRGESHSPNALKEQIWRINENGKYAKELSSICQHLQKSREFAENDEQKQLIDLLIEYYHTGDLRIFDEYSKLWVQEKSGTIDFINGFIEVYGDPLGYKGTWESLVEYVDEEATKRTQTIAENAQWFEDNSPVDPRFKKKEVKGVSARVICAAMLGGDCYPATPIGINLPNAEWIRERYGSKSVTISNIIHAYNEAGKSSGVRDEFTKDPETLALLKKYADDCDTLHTDLHECLGHGSGQLLPGVSSDALKNYGSTIEEARADLFGLYYCADEKMVELGLLPNMEAHKSMYYSYLLNGLLVQLSRIKLGNKIEEDHMRNRALIARWALDLAKESSIENRKSAIENRLSIIDLYQENGKTFLRINDYEKLRSIFAFQLKEIQRIKSEGDYEAAKLLVEKYGVNIEEDLHKEILDRYNALNLAPYKGFINPVLNLVKDERGEIIDVVPDYTENYSDQMLRYGRNGL